jgi:predicted metalloprotease with PDZ domain
MNVDQTYRKVFSIRQFGSSAIRQLLIAALLLGPLAAQVASPEDAPPERIRYSIELKDASQHLVHVRVELPPGMSQRDLQLPVWNATYMVRDFAQFVNHVKAESAAGRPIALRQLTGSSWRIWGAERGAAVDYDETLDMAGPFGAQYNDHHAFFNLAMVLMYPTDARSTPVQLRIVGAPREWNLASPAAAAAPAIGGSGMTIFAANYDRLVDSPVEVGTFRYSTFELGGAGYTVVVDADPSDYDMSTVTATLRKIVTAETAWMSDRPFTHYTFIYHFPRGPAGGGMEHAYGTAIDMSASRIKPDSTAIADVSAHEFFHLWNVKRIRPQSLEPVDYTREQETRALWFSEGVTSTVGSYALLRAGITDERRFLDSLGRSIGQLQAAPAHLTMSPEESSLSTWFDKYPNYRALDRSVSYYTQGDVLGVLLDLQMLDATSGQKGLRELLRYLNEQYAKQGRFFDDSAGIRDAAEVVAGRSFRDFFEKYVAGVDEIPYDEFFRGVGLRLDRSPAKVAEPGFTTSRAPSAAAGLVASVSSGSAAEKAGLRAGDIVGEIDGEPFSQTSQRELGQKKPGDAVKLKITRGGRAQEISYALGSRDEQRYSLADVDGITPAQRERRAIWLGTATGAAAQ